MKNGRIIQIFTALSVWISGRNKGKPRSWTIGVSVFAFFVLFLPAHAFTIDDYLTIPPQRVPHLVFKDADGTDRALSDFRGKFVLLNVWATWCPPCAKEMLQLEALQKEFDPHKLVVLPLSEDSDEDIVRAFYRKHELKRLPIAMDNALRTTSSLRLRGLPTTLVIDREGNEILRIEESLDRMSVEISHFLRHRIGAN
jgi:thiol-disulfide isomerase/thioredoxin